MTSPEIYLSADVEADGPIPGPHSMLSFASAAYLADKTLVAALDIKTYAMATLKKNYRDATKRNMPREWFDALPHTHVALDDAIEQGALSCNMLKASRSKPA